MKDYNAKNIAVIGAGSWGCALAVLLNYNKNNVTLVSNSKEKADLLYKYRENKNQLPGVILDKNIKITVDLKDAIKGKDVIVLAIPSKCVRSTLRKIKEYCVFNKIIVSASKGIENISFKRISEQIKEELESCEVAVLSGPSHAEEVSRKIETYVVVASTSKDVAIEIKNIFKNEYFKIHIDNDVAGVEIAGAYKNIIALAVGILEGISCGDNTKSALITKSLEEMKILGVALGCKKDTFYGLAGIGDIIDTCESKYSRNRKMGYLIGKGYSLVNAEKEVNMVVEGITALKSFLGIAKKLNLHLSILEEINKILFENKLPKDSLKELMLKDN